MIERKVYNQIINNPAYQYVGKDELTGMNMYLVPCRENISERKKTQLDDGLFDDDNFPNEYYQDLDMPPVKARDYDNLTKKDFETMDYKEIYYSLYH